jgi:nitrogen fixation NifU-like protein
VNECETAIEYNEEVLAHLREPHNVGYISRASGVGELGDGSCGDHFMFFVRVANDRLVEVKYLIKGCGAAVSACSALSDLATGLTLDEAERLTEDDIAGALGGLPLDKLHCGNYAATTLRRAIADHRRRQADGLDDYDLDSLLGSLHAAGSES